VPELIPLADRRLLTFGGATIRFWTPGQPAAQELRGHTDQIYSVDLSPDRTELASASSDTTVRVWNLATGAWRPLIGHSEGVYGARFSPDGRRLLTCSGDTTARLWDLASGRSVRLGHDNGVLDCLFPRPALILTCSLDATVRVWSLEGKLLALHRAGTGCIDLILAPDAQTVAALDRDDVVRLWPVPGHLMPASDADLPAYLDSISSAIILSHDLLATPLH
jgi:WD40 repeat protein